jgi:hypothetical protein
MSDDDYRLFVNEDRTVMVRIWTADESDAPHGIVEVATREHPSGVWGPPKVLKEER